MPNRLEAMFITLGKIFSMPHAAKSMYKVCIFIRAVLSTKSTIKVTIEKVRLANENFYATSFCVIAHRGGCIALEKP